MGWRRLKEKTVGWRLMQRYVGMKKSKGSGKAIIATARKIAMIVWNMLTEDVEFDLGLMVDKKLAKKSVSMSGSVGLANKALTERKPVESVEKKKGKGVKKSVKKPGVAREKRKKVG